MSKTRLTKETRAEIIERVVRATNIPELKDSIKSRTKAAAVQIVRNAQPEGFYEVTRSLPKEWFQTAHSLYVPTHMDGVHNPLRIIGVVSQHSHHIDFDDLVTVAERHGEFSYELLAPLTKEAEELAERESQLRGEISSFLNSCRYVEDIVERMPELEPHIPRHSKSFPLTAPSNLLSTLSSLGFDKTVKA